MKCPECEGEGYHQWMETIPGHSSGCDSSGCCSDCPIPVGVERQEPCEICDGTGELKENE